MRAIVMAAALTILAGTALAGPKPAQKPAAKPSEITWIAICLGEDSQYTQTLGGAGFFHVGNGDRTYQTQRLVQSQFDGNTVCAVPDPKAPRASTDIALICADRNTKTVSVIYGADAKNKAVRPSNAVPYCQARVDVLQ